MNKFKAFTLAEVLITLAIVGVIASITIPSVIIKYQKEQTITHLKKFYSIMEQVINDSTVENGAVETWDFSLSETDFLNKYLKYLSTNNKVCSFPSYNRCSVPSKKYLDGTNADDEGFRKYTNLNSGEQIGISGYSATHDVTPGKLIAVDLNGDKNPNRWGKDVFIFAIRSRKPYFVPFSCCGNLNKARRTNYVISLMTATSGGCSKDITGWHSGAYCAALIIKDGWKISNDYPW